MLFANWGWGQMVVTFPTNGTDQSTSNVQTTWTVPSGVSSIQVEVWGGGGGGCGRYNISGSGAAGGGGAYARKGSFTVNTGDVLYIQVGKQGTGKGTGAQIATDGGISYVKTGSHTGTIISAAGGGTGGTNVSSFVCSGGPGSTSYTINATSPTTNDKFWFGGIGGDGGCNSNGGSGGGGAGSGGHGSSPMACTGIVTAGGSAWGSSLSGGVGGKSYNNSAPDAAGIRGGGGGGCGTTSAFSGGNGGGGFVRITYSVTPAPTISNFTPSSVCASSSANVTITGTNFTNASAVSIGGTAASSFTVISATQITATVGAGTTGTISVTTPGGTATSTGTLTVNTKPPTPTAISASRCSTGVVELGVLSNPNGTINWYTDAALTTLATNGTVTACTNSTPCTTNWTTPSISATTSYFATRTNTAGCQSDAVEVIATVNPNPSAPASPVNYTGCVGDASMSVTAQFLGTINWYTDAALTSSAYSLTTTSNNQVVTYTPFLSSSQTYYVTRTITTTGCRGPYTTVTATVYSPNANASNGDYVWRGGTSNDWATNTNWVSYNGSAYSTPANPPPSTSSPNVLIPATSTNCPVSNYPNTSSNTAYANNLTIETNATLTMGSGNLNVNGNFTNDGTFTAGTGTVVFKGTGTIGGTTETVFYNLTMDGTGITTSLGNNATIQNALALSNGKLNLGTKLLTLGTSSSNATITGGSSTSFIVTGETISNNIGRVKRFINLDNTYNFPIGNFISSVNYYTPLNITFHTGTTRTAGSFIEVYTKNEKVPSLDFQYTLDSYINRYWSVEPTGFTNQNYDIDYTYHNVDIHNTENDLMPLKLTGTTWYCPTNSLFTSTTQQGTGVLDANTNKLTWTGLSTFSFFGAAGNKNAILPVNLINFKANCVNKNVKLNWQTASESNNDYFDIERSTDGLSYANFLRVNGNGTTNEQHNYTAYDEQPLAGNTYYRLKQVDFNGSTTYYNPQMVNCADDANSSIYPNPNNGTFLIKGLQEESELQLIDALGKNLLTKNVSANETTYEVTTLQEGIYFLLIKTKLGLVQTQKIIVQK